MQKKRNIIHATINAVDGFKELALQKAARRELVLAAIAIGFFCYRPNVYTVLVAVLSLVLLAVEALNTAIEKICDLITLEEHPEIKKIKDLGAAAVMIIVVAIGLIFIRYLSPYF
ncbi:diacylglycerol kinase [Polynucleobacter sp. MG-27-Goln-C1]|uniref:diacylglycerol kinase n=1 Tax=Polynucleobacter sp. MG-27-Goln-C1 TaxID=1819726 RepID=UPI001C0DCE1F|nr:diacylglycerol kinase [Polynucleobacter sp. MG-27-Goln-C1]MBU3613084.1 diacylglycerol kinase [Polynucleobacter sp. MG-27-Goln-C1]